MSEASTVSTHLVVRRACGCVQALSVTTDDGERPRRTLFDAEYDELVRRLSLYPCGLHSSHRGSGA